MNKLTKLSAAKEFAAWAGIDVARVDQWAETFVVCDTAVAHGPGHQSITLCEDTRADHTYHHNNQFGFEWMDEDLSDQTYTRRTDGKTLRIVFEGRTRG